MIMRPHRFRITALLLAVLAATAAAYWPGTHGAFLLDDFPNIVQNPALRNPHPGLANVAKAVSEVHSGPLGRPIAMATFALNVWTDGMRPGPMKVTNLAIHLFNGLLVFFLLRLLLHEYRRRRPDTRETTCDWAALAVTAAWLLAPINLTAVLYIVQRMTSLAATFTLAGLICYVAGRKRLLSSGRTTPGTLLLAASGLIFTPLAVLTKEVGALTPLYALVIEWVFFGFRGRNANWSKLTLGYFAAFLAIPGIIGAVLVLPDRVTAAAYAARPFTLGERVLTEGRVLWHYLYWTLVPDIRSLTLYHDAFPVSRGLFSPWTSLPAWFGIATLLGIGVSVRRRFPLLSFGILWFLAGQLLTATVIPLDLVFEHRMYLPSLGLFALLFIPLVLAVGDSRLRMAGVGAAAALVLLYAGGLTLRSLDWSNPLTQMAIAARTHPDSPRATYGYGRVLAQIADRRPQVAPEAFQALEHAEAVPRQSATPESTLIIMASNLNRPVRARWYRQMAATLAARPPNPQDISALYALVQCALRSTHPCHLNARWMQTVFASALDHHPSNNVVAALYGNYLLNVEQSPGEAARIFRLLVRAAPSNANYHYDLGVAALADRDIATARRELAALRRLNHLGVHQTQIDKLSDLIHEVTSKNAPRS